MNEPSTSYRPKHRGLRSTRSFAKGSGWRLLCGGSGFKLTGGGFPLHWSWGHWRGRVMPTTSLCRFRLIYLYSLPPLLRRWLFFLRKKVSYAFVVPVWSLFHVITLAVSSIRGFVAFPHSLRDARGGFAFVVYVIQAVIWRRGSGRQNRSAAA